MLQAGKKVKENLGNLRYYIHFIEPLNRTLFSFYFLLFYQNREIVIIARVSAGKKLVKNW